jgi:hypothetical protein
MKQLLFFLILFFTIPSYAQNTSTKSLKFGAGIGFAESENCTGIGTHYSIGYQKNIYKDRLRFNPNISVGFYSPIFITDLPDQYFNSININANLNYDIIKIRRFSVLIYGGIETGIVQGYVGSGGMPFEDENGNLSSGMNDYYIHDFHIGGNLGAGFRILSKSQNTAFNFLPFNFRIGYPRFIEAFYKLEVDIKF